MATTQDDKAALAAHLKRWRDLRQYTQADAAKYLRVPLDTYRAWESGRQVPRGLGWNSLIEKTSK